MASSFAPNPLTILQRREENTSQTQRTKKKLVDILPSPSPLLLRPVSPIPRLRRSATSPLPILRRSVQVAGQGAGEKTMRSGSDDGARELLVLAHGLQGMVDDFKYLLEALHKTAAAVDGSLLIHASKVNEHKTHDGITLGGLRLAEDIRMVIQQNTSLKSISLVGFSLGGLYVRYAIGHLFNAQNGSIAGLSPSKIVIVASPNLGVRNFGVYRFIPEGMKSVVKQLVLGNSTSEVLLMDDELLLERMTRDDEIPFMSALESFEKRTLYANIRNDLMVNYGTAALDTRVKGLNGEDVMRERVNEAVDREYDDKGCKIAFEFWINARDRDESEDGESCVEEVMADRLRRVGWRVVGVDFPVGLPITHNRIVAMSRNLIHTWINASGRRAVHHLVDTVSQGFDQHTCVFKAVV